MAVIYAYVATLECTIRGDEVLMYIEKMPIFWTMCRGMYVDTHTELPVTR